MALPKSRSARRTTGGILTAKIDSIASSNPPFLKLEFLTSKTEGKAQRINDWTKLSSLLGQQGFMLRKIRGRRGEVGGYVIMENGGSLSQADYARLKTLLQHWRAKYRATDYRKR